MLVTYVTYIAGGGCVKNKHKFLLNYYSFSIIELGGSKTNLKV